MHVDPARVAALVEWAHSRIWQCRRDEAKFGAGDVSIEAARERRMLATVLGMLGVNARQPNAEERKELDALAEIGTRHRAEIDAKARRIAEQTRARNARGKAGSDGR